MPLNTEWAVAARNARLSGLATQAASGFLDLYSGTQPATGDATVTGVMLASLALPASPFAAPTSGSMANNSALSGTGTTGATGSGTAAGYAVLFKSDHATVLGMFSVGTSAANITLPSTTITTGETVSIAIGAFVVTDDASVLNQ